MYSFPAWSNHCLIAVHHFALTVATSNKFLIGETFPGLWRLITLQIKVTTNVLYIPASKFLSFDIYDILYRHFMHRRGSYSYTFTRTIAGADISNLPAQIYIWSLGYLVATTCTSNVSNMCIYASVTTNQLPDSGMCLYMHFIYILSSNNQLDDLILSPNVSCRLMFDNGHRKLSPLIWAIIYSAYPGICNCLYHWY